MLTYRVTSHADKCIHNYQTNVGRSPNSVRRSFASCHSQRIDFDGEKRICLYAGGRNRRMNGNRDRSGGVYVYVCDAEGGAPRIQPR